MMYIIVETEDGKFEGDAHEINFYRAENNGGNCFVGFTDGIKMFKRKELKTISIFVDEGKPEDAKDH